MTLVCCPGCGKYIENNDKQHKCVCSLRYCKKCGRNKVFYPDKTMNWHCEKCGTVYVEDK